MSAFASSGYSRNSDSVAALKEAYKQAKVGLEGEAHTAWIMASHHHADNLEQLEGKLPVKLVFGGTAYGALTEHGESEEEPGFGLLLLSHPTLEFVSRRLPADKESFDEVEWGRRIGKDLEDAAVAWLFLNLSLIHI